MQRRNKALWGICLLGATVSCSGGLVSVGDRDRDASGSTGGSGSVGSGGATMGSGGSHTGGVTNGTGVGGVTNGVGGVTNGTGVGGSAPGDASPDAFCLQTGACLQNYHFDHGLCRCVPDPPDGGCVSGVGEHCGGNTAFPCTCASGLACRPGDSGLPFGDVGGFCQPIDSIPDAGCVSGLGGPCGGNTPSRCICASGLACLTGDSGLLDVGGVCLPLGTTPDGGGRLPMGNCPLIPPGDPGNPVVGACSLLGHWSLSNSHGTVQTSGVIEFDADGSYYGGPTGTDLSQTYTYDGSYDVNGSTFQLNFSCGDGTCVGGGTFDLAFQNNCAVAILTERLTQCTGNRLSVAGEVILIR